MKRWIAVLMVVCMLLPALALAGDFDKVEDAKLVIGQILAGDVDAYYDRLSDEVKAQMPREVLEAFGDQLTAQAGAFIEFGSTSTVGPTAVIEMKMADISVQAQVAYAEDGAIIGFGFMPAAEYAVDETLGEGEEAVTVGPLSLGGVLTMPKDAVDKVPAVVLVHGSGPNDRNETAGGVTVFKDIAEGLSKAGIAVLRYDKRTFAANAGAIELTAEDIANMTAKEETIDDAVAAVALLRADDRIDPERVYVLGHSQGGMLAGRIQQAGADANGLIILAGTLRHLTTLMGDQLEALDPDGLYTDEITLARALPDMTEEEARESTIIGQNAYFLWEEAQHDLIAAAEANDAPVLILQGAEDLNVYADVDYVLWQEFAEAHPDKNFTFHLYEGLDHLFNEGNAVSAQVIADIAAWINER